MFFAKKVFEHNLIMFVNTLSNLSALPMLRLLLKASSLVCEAYNTFSSHDVQYFR